MPKIKLASEWKDVTSYSRGDEERVPRSWEITLLPEDHKQSQRLCVTRSINHSPDEWVLRWGRVERVLEHRAIEEAKLEALMMVLKELRDLTEAVMEALSALPLSPKKSRKKT